MNKKDFPLKKVLSVFLVFAMTLTMITAISLMLGENQKAHAYGTYTKQKTTEYYHSSTSKFFSSGVTICAVSTSKADETLRGNKYTPVGSNFNAGIGPTSGYIIHGVKFTTNPAKAIKAYAVRDTDAPDTYTGPAANGANVTWELVSGCNLNTGNNGKPLRLYVTYDYEAGPAVSSFTVGSDNDDQTARNELLDNGYTPALDQNGNWQNCNEGNNGWYAYAGYQSSCTVINSDNLRTAYNYAKYLYENGGSNTPGLSSALTNAEAVLSDLNDGYTTRKQSVIDNYTRALYDAVPAITPETEYSALVGTANMLRYYKFTPSTTGSYVFYSCGSGDAQGYIYNKTNSGTGIGSVVASNDNAPGYMRTTLGQSSNQFYMTANLTAGTTYLLMVRFSGTGTGTVKFKVANARNITFNATGGSANTTLVLPQGQSIKFSNVRTTSNTTFTRTDHSLIAWSANGKGAEEKFHMNTESFTVPSANTTYYALWNPSNAETLTLNKAYTATISAGSQINYYQFTPSKTGKYICYGTSSTDTFGILYNADTYAANATYLSVSDNDGRAALGQSSNQFCIAETLTAGTKYLIGVKFNGTGTGSVPFRIEQYYTVTYNANGGVNAPAAQDKYYNKALELYSAVPTRTGYTFLGWATSSSATSASYQAGSSYNTNSDLKLYAVWQANTYAVTLDNNNATTAGTTAVTATYDSVMPSAVMPVKAGHTFGGYYDGENGTGTQYYTADGTSARTWDKTEAATLYANWTINTYTITFKDADGTIMKTVTADYGTIPTAPSIPDKESDEDYHYAGAWNAEIVPAAADTTYTVTYLSYSHSGGTANCVDKAVCTVCGSTYGVLDTENHKTVIEDEAINATCTSAGLTAGSHCSACNTVITEQSSISKIPHAFTVEDAVSEKLASEATCTAKATYYYTCENCDAVSDTLTFEIGEMLPHTFTKKDVSDEKLVSEATCTEKAVYYFTCENCDAVSDTLTFENGEMLPHTFTKKDVSDEKLVSEATCTAKAVYYFTCENCDAVSDTLTFENGEMLLHAYGEWTVTVEATCNLPGTERRDCADCEAYETRETSVNPANHTGETYTQNENIVAATCSKEGSYDLVTYCKDCDVKLTSKKQTIEVNANNHVGETYTQDEDIHAASCIAKGSYSLVTYCSDCNEKLSTEAREIATNPTAHTGINHIENFKDSTCTEAGYTGDTICECGTKLDDGKEIAIKAHTYSAWKAVVSSTCMTAGTERRTCTSCTAFEERTTAINSAAHTGNNTYDVGKKAATCTESGYTGDTVCECGKVIVKGAAISKKAHNLVVISETAPTEEENGEIVYECTECGHIERKTIPANNICEYCGTDHHSFIVRIVCTITRAIRSIVKLFRGIGDIRVK